jgi:uncharacterized membrane protein YjjP (DUF1212 family)
VNSDRATFVLELGVAMQRAGTGTAELESSLRRVAAGLGLEARFFSVPTALWASFQDGEDEWTRMLPVEAADTDLSRLERLRALSRRVEGGGVELDAAWAELRGVVARPPMWRKPALCAAFASVSGPAAALFGGGVPEVVTASLAGLVAGVIAVRGIGPAAPAVSAAAATGVALVGSVVFGGLAADVAILSGLIVLVPGFTIHRGMTDLSTGHLLSGTARVAQALTMLLLMGFGLALMARIGGLSDAAPAGSPLWLKTLAIVAMTPGLLVLFQAPLSVTPTAVGSGMIAWFGGLLGVQLLGPELGAFLAALAVGVYANTWERLTDRPAALALVPGLMLLVPGSVGFRAVSAVLDGRTVVAVETGFSVLMTSVSLVAGLLAANILTAEAALRVRPPGRWRRTRPKPASRPARADRAR